MATNSMPATKTLKKNHGAPSDFLSRYAKRYSPPYTAASADNPRIGTRKKALRESISALNAPCEASHGRRIDSRVPLSRTRRPAPNPARTRSCTAGSKRGRCARRPGAGKSGDTRQDLEGDRNQQSIHAMTRLSPV